MPKPNPNLLADALKRKAQGVVPALSATPKVEQPRRGRSIRSAGRTGKIMVSGWLPLEARSSFRMIQAKHPEKLMQDLIMEAMNDLFAKYNVPQTAHLEPDLEQSED